MRMPVTSWLQGSLVALLLVIPPIIGYLPTKPPAALLGMAVLAIVLGAPLGWAVKRFAG